MAKIATAFIFVALVALAASQGFGSPSQPPPQQPPAPANPSPAASGASGSELPPSTPSTVPTTTVGTLVPVTNSTSPLAEKHVGEEHGKNGASTTVAVASGILLVLTAPLLM